MGLHEVPPGACARVLALGNGTSMRRRLRDMGMIEDTVVECVGRSPGGDPSAYLIRGAVIALRQRDACMIQVCPVAREGAMTWD